MEERRKLRFDFPAGERALVKFKIILKHGEQLHPVHDAVLLDLSEGGARLQGSLPSNLFAEVLEGHVTLGCNLYLSDKLVKALATVKWAKKIVADEYEFGVAFKLSSDNLAEIKKFLIRHQIDTRRFKRLQHEKKNNPDIR